MLRVMQAWSFGWARSSTGAAATAARNLVRRPGFTKGPFCSKAMVPPEGVMSPFKRPGSAPGSFHASFEVLPGNGPADEPSGAAAGEAPRAAYAVRADPMLLDAVRRVMPELFALPSGDDTPSAGAGGGAGGAAFARLSPAASAVLADAAAAAAAASETAITLEIATHVWYGGCLYPLLWNADGEPIILAPNYTNVRALPGVGTRLLRLPPCSTARDRIEQLRALGAVVGDASEREPDSEESEWDGDTESDHDDWVPPLPLVDGGAHLHVVLPNGDVAPVFPSPDHPKLGHLHYYAAPRASVSGQVATCKAWPNPVCQTLAKLPVDRYHEVYLA